MQGFWFIFAIVFMAIGLIGTIIPVIPGTTIICVAAVIHCLVLGVGHSIGWTAVIAIVGLTLISYGVDAAAGWLGAKRFGATKWGVLGGIAGAMAGIFLGLPGLFIGPIVGAIAGEFIGGQRLVAAGRAGWGTLLGNLVGMIIKLFLGLIMIAIFFMNVPSPL